MIGQNVMFFTKIIEVSSVEIDLSKNLNQEGNLNWLMSLSLG